MLAQLRLQYPQSCLISELLKIKHGKYIVRALVEIEGVAIATGLGSGETVEIAEDHARDRVLAVLDLGSQLSAKVLELDSPQEIAPVIPPTPAVAAPVIAPPVITIFEPPVVEPVKVVAAVEPPVVEPLKVAAAPVIQPVVPEVKTPEIQVPISIVQPQVEAEINAEINQEAVTPPELPPFPLKEKTEEKPERVIPLHIVPDTQPVETYPPLVAIAPEPETVDIGADIRPDNGDKEEKKAKTKTPPVAIPDIKDVMARTEIEIRRLGWTTQQGRNFLLQRYGKRARTLLSDEELLDFLSYLEEQPVAE